MILLYPHNINEIAYYEIFKHLSKIIFYILSEVKNIYWVYTRYVFFFFLAKHIFSGSENSQKVERSPIWYTY